MNSIFNLYTKEQYQENKILGYYYNKLLKKAFLSLKFNLFSEKSYYYFKSNDNSQNHFLNENQPSQQINNQAKYNPNIFNFFHNNLSNNHDNTNEMFKQYTEMFNTENIDIKHLTTNASENENQQTQIKEECESVVQVNDLIDHLQLRYKELAIQSKQVKQLLPIDESTTNGNSKHRKCNSSSTQHISPNVKQSHYEKAKQYSKKVNNKNVKKPLKHNKNYNKQICVTCPYCVTNIYHDKCIGGNEVLQQQFNPNILLGAPSFSKNTCNFIHKNLYY